jgi:hypothetical protein
MYDYLNITGSGLIFFLLGLFIALKLTDNSVDFKLKLYLFHTLFSVFYCFYTVYGGKSADALTYYANNNFALAIGTASIFSLTFLLKTSFSASYLDLFLLYQIAGFVGILLLYDLVREIIESISFSESKIRYFIFFLPGLHFWTSSIGKDSIIFLGIVVCIWSLYSFNQRMFHFLWGFAIVFIIRPHVGGIIVLALLLSIAFDSKSSAFRKFLGLATVSILLIVLLPYVSDFTGLDAVEEVDEYIAKRQGYNTGGGGGVDISELPFLLQFATYLYRPLFFDAKDIMGLIVSFENLLLVSQSLKVVRGNWLRIVSKVDIPRIFLNFNFFYFLMATSIFAMTTSNSGIAIRQKTMVLPSLIVMIFVTYAYSLSPPPLPILPPYRGNINSSESEDI